MKITESYCCDTTIIYHPPLELDEAFDPDEEEGYFYEVYLKDFPNVSMIGETPEEALAELGHTLNMFVCTTKAEDIKGQEDAWRYIRGSAHNLYMHAPKGWKIFTTSSKLAFCSKVSTE